jgi:CDP-2,3-bis-(O-geranylgeranyl)-sn-glycerol synthase
VEPVDVLRVLYFFGPAYAADLSPLLARELVRGFDVPLDGRVTFRGKRLLGSHKTWRGLIACVVAGIVTYEVQRLLYEAGLLRDLAQVDYSHHVVLPGFLMGLGAGVGDAVKSFFKRRAGIAPGRTWLFFDQLDSFFGALVFVSLVVVPPLGVVAVVVPIVFSGEILATIVFYRLGLKESWI